MTSSTMHQPVHDGTPPILCMVLEAFPQISQTFILNEILKLESLGFRIHIISPAHSVDGATHENVKKIKALTDYLPSRLLKYVVPLSAHNCALAVKYPKRYFKAALTAWKQWLGTRRTSTVMHLLKAGYLVNKCLAGKNIVHFHAHSSGAPASVAMFASLLSGLPFSFSAHASDIFASQQKALRNVQKKELIEKIEMARFVVTCSQYNKNYLKQINPRTRTPVFRVYHGTDLKFFMPQHRTAECHPPYRILTVAGMSEKKGLETIYRALALLKEKGIAFEHFLIGASDENSTIPHLIQKLGLKEKTHLLGEMKPEQLIRYYEDCDLFVLGCKVAQNGDRDGIPDAMVESMAMKLPVVATDISGLPEILLDEITGLSVPQKNHMELARVMLRMLTEKPLREKVMDKAYRKVVLEFDNAVLIRQLADIYCKMIPALGCELDLKNGLSGS